MGFFKAVILAILTGLILPLAKDYIAKNYLTTSDVYKPFTAEEKPSGEPVKR